MIVPGASCSSGTNFLSHSGIHQFARAQQAHRGRQHHHANECRVEQHTQREPDTNLFDRNHVRRGERAEGAHQQEPSRGNHPGCVLQLWGGRT